METTHHSEFLKLHSLFIKPAKNAFVSQFELENQWQKLNYLSLPDYHESLKEYRTFQSYLKSDHINSLHFPVNDSTTIDSIYCRDASIATDFGMIICNMGKQGRANEPESQAKVYKSNSIPILGAIKSPGTIEGGDVVWLDDKTLAVGHSYRTNEHGIQQLKKLLKPKGIRIIVVELPHYKGKTDVFHLMSIISPIDRDLAVVYSPLMPIKFRNELLDRGFELIEVPEKEFETLGCNVLALEPRHCIMVQGNPVTKKKLEQYGCKVKTYKGEEISIKGGGGPTCLTRPLLRSY
jgi:N-dimethylarginine dimethylaminohydrolase